MGIEFSLSMMNGFLHHGFSKEMMEWTRSRFLTKGLMDIQIPLQTVMVGSIIIYFIGVVIYG